MTVITLAFAGSLLIITPVLAAPPKITLDQCRNGSASTQNDCISLGGSAGWVNGNAGASNAHFVEGHSIPYRAVITDGPTGSQNVVFGYDIKHSGVNAIDFLTHFQRLEPHSPFGHTAETVTPLSGVNGVDNNIATCAIPKPSNLSAGASTTFDFIKNTENKNNFTVYGASSCSVTQVEVGDVTQAQSEARVRVTYEATSSTVVMAWGGHIARSPDWNGNGAAQISGSPYHMRLKEWSAGNVGNQDRSLSAAAVIAEQSTTATTIHLDGSHTVVPITTSIALGSSVHDLATVTGLGPTGNVTFSFYRGGDCTTGTLESAGVRTLSPVDASTSVAHPSDSKTTLTAGDYAFRATYAGDGNNVASTSACEPFTVSRGNLTLSTQIHIGDGHTTNYDRNASMNGSASAPIGSVAHDVAVVSGAVSGIAPTGSITFSFYATSNCTGTATTLASAGADQGGSGTRSVATSALAPGDYSFTATIAADANYNTATSPCEWLRVDKATPTLTTSPWIYPNDSAVMSGLVSPQSGSTLVFTAHTANTCSATSQIYSQTFNNIVNQTYSTTNGAGSPTPVKVESSSIVYWKVVYSGDANNNARTSDCVEKIDVTLTPDPIPAP